MHGVDARELEKRPQIGRRRGAFHLRVEEEETIMLDHQKRERGRVGGVRPAWCILGSGGRMRKGGEGEGARTGRWEKRKLRPRERIGKGDAATSSREHLSHLLPLFPPSVGEL